MDSHRFSSSENYPFENRSSEPCNTRRSIDWRDSGIVIDDDNLIFQSIDTLNDPSKNERILQTEDQDAASKSHNRGAISPSSNIDNEGDTMLHIAIVGLPMEQVKDLISISDLNAANYMLQTPLHLATMVDRPEIVNILVQSGAKIDIRDRKGNTPLHVACQKGLVMIADILLDHASNRGGNSSHYLETANFDGQTSLHLAASNGQRDIIELLVFKYNADVNCRDNRSGETIMHKALKSLDGPLVTFIANMPQHCNLDDFSGRNPLDTVRLMKHSCPSFEVESMLSSMESAIVKQIETCCASGGCCIGMNRERHSGQVSSSDSDSDFN